MTLQRHRLITLKIQGFQKRILGKVQILCLISHSQVHRLSIQTLITDKDRWTCTLAGFLKTFLVFIFKGILRFKKKLFCSFWRFRRQNLDYQTCLFNLTPLYQCQTRDSWPNFSTFQSSQLQKVKVGCILPMVVVSTIHHEVYGQNDHREDALHFTQIPQQLLHSVISKHGSSCIKLILELLKNDYESDWSIIAIITWA